MQTGDIMKNHLKKLRFKKNGMTQEELAKRAGISRQTVIAIEKGRFNPSIRLVLKFSKILKCNIEELFELEEGD